MKILIKRPYTEIKILDVNSTNLPNLENELGYKFSIFQLSRGYVLLLPINKSCYDEPNFVVEDIYVNGTAFIIKAGLNRLLDLTEDAITDVNEMITFSNVLE
ncbi:MAG: hypothetical protein LCH34_14290 [Firmicutes bacterium]|nr:hypothetical protein [Bacillota bacterium]